MALGNCQTLISSETYTRALGRLGVVLPSVPYNLFPSRFGFSATTKSSPKVHDGDSIMG